MSTEKRDYLEVLIRQQFRWFVEIGSDGVSNEELIAHRRADLATLKAELGVTDEKAFLEECAKARLI
jgi:hypothetical protein